MTVDLKLLLELEEGATLLGEHLIVTRGSSEPTLQSVNDMYDEFERLIGDKPLVWNIHIFTPSARPSREVRNLVIARFSQVKYRVGFVALVARKNLFVHVVASLISLRMRYTRFRIYESAIEAYHDLEHMAQVHFRDIDRNA